VNFNPITNKLFTDEGFLIKKLNCRYGISWSDLSRTGNEGTRHCLLCEKDIIDTINLSGSAVLEMTRRDSSICLKVDINQANIRVVNFDVES
jgi:hypothetical protein